MQCRALLVAIEVKSWGMLLHPRDSRAAMGLTHDVISVLPFEI